MDVDRIFRRISFLGCLNAIFYLFKPVESRYFGPQLPMHNFPEDTSDDFMTANWIMLIATIIFCIFSTAFVISVICCCFHKKGCHKREKCFIEDSSSEETLIQHKTDICKNSPAA